MSNQKEYLKKFLKLKTEDEPRKKKKKASKSEYKDYSDSEESDHQKSRRPSSGKKRRSPLEERQSESPHRKKLRESPPKERHSRWDSPPINEEPPTQIQNGKAQKTLEGKKAGLQYADSLREESEMIRQREKEYFEKMDPGISGRGAKTIMRGERKREEIAKRKRKEEEDDKQTQLDNKYKQWSRGMKQASDKAARIEDELHETNKPFARYADDEDLENHLKKKDRHEDPMLPLLMKKRSKDAPPPNKGRPVYRGEYPPNRYGIRPGYRWDGVNRSNGFEVDLFERKNRKKAQADDAYKWSTEDM